MIDAEEDAALGEIHEQRDEIIATLLKLNVLALAEIVGADVHFGAAGHPAGEFFADENIRVPAQLFRAFDGIMIGKGDQVHATELQLRINFLGIAVTFAAKLSDNRGCAGPGEVRVNMQVAFHDYKCTRDLLRAYDIGAKVVKSQLFNSFVTNIIF